MIDFRFTESGLRCARFAHFNQSNLNAISVEEVRRPMRSWKFLFCIHRKFLAYIFTIQVSILNYVRAKCVQWPTFVKIYENRFLFCFHIFLAGSVYALDELKFVIIHISTFHTLYGPDIKNNPFRQVLTRLLRATWTFLQLYYLRMLYILFNKLVGWLDPL